MGTFEQTAEQVSALDARDNVYTIAQSASSGSPRSNQTTVNIGQFRSYTGTYTVVRAGFRFDLTSFTVAEIAAATLKIYGAQDRSDTNFDITLVGAEVNTPPEAYEYGLFGTTDYGNFYTAGFKAAGWNTITFNAAGVAFLNAQVQTGKIQVGLRSNKDISITAPSGEEYVNVEGFDNTNRPTLTLTYSEWPDTAWPFDPLFPLQGKVDLATYSIIKFYMEDADAEIGGMTDGNGNIDLAVDNWITWTGTSEKVAYDDTNSRVTVTTLASTSIITLVDALTTVDLTIDVTGSAVNATVGNNVTMTDAVYAGIQSVTVDNEITFSAHALSGASDGEGRLDMDSTEGDLVWAVRDDGQAGAKSEILADFSAI